MFGEPGPRHEYLPTFITGNKFFFLFLVNSKNQQMHENKKITYPKIHLQRRVNRRAFSGPFDMYLFL